MSANRILGLDFGTTCCSVAVVGQRNASGKRCASIVRATSGAEVIPSMVFFDETGNAVVGDAAARRWEEGASDVIKDIKQFMGTDEMIANRSPTEIATKIFEHLREEARKALGDLQPSTRAVVSIPVHFDDRKKNETIAAAENAGFETVEIVREPVAAALSVLLEDDVDYHGLHNRGERALVYDLGGGTFDMCVVEYGDNMISLEQSIGSGVLGGRLWDEALASIISEKLGEESPALNSGLIPRRLTEAQRIKHELTGGSTALLYRDGCHRAQISREEFEARTSGLVDQTVRLTEYLLKEAMKTQIIQRLILCGGSCHMPMIEQAMQRFVRQTIARSVERPTDPQLAVAKGAAIFGSLIWPNEPSTNGKKKKRVQINRMDGDLKPAISVAPEDLGVIVFDDSQDPPLPVYHRLVEEGASLVCKEDATALIVRRNAKTVVANQQRITIRVVQGRMAEGSQHNSTRPSDIVCQCGIVGLPPDQPKGTKVALEFKLSQSGCLKIIATHASTNLIASAERWHYGFGANLRQCNIYVSGQIDIKVDVVQKNLSRFLDCSHNSITITDVRDLDRRLTLDLEAELLNRLVRGIQNTPEKLVAAMRPLIINSVTFSNQKCELPKMPASPSRDVFLCYNRNDRAEVRKVRSLLKDHGINPWFDEDDVLPGTCFSVKIEEAILKIPVAAIFMGTHGLGDYQQNHELTIIKQAYLKDVSRRVIPVFLRTAGTDASFPGFIETFSWIDFRSNSEDAQWQLFRAILDVDRGFTI